MFCTSCGSNKLEANGLCASCNHASRKAAKVKVKVVTPVKIKLHSLSTDRRRLEYKYKQSRNLWIKEQVCAAMFDHECYGPLTCHHKMGRVGFADQWARDNDIPLLIDKRYWIALCLNSHQFIEMNPLFAIDNRYSLPRNELK